MRRYPAALRSSKSSWQKRFSRSYPGARSRHLPSSWSVSTGFVATGMGHLRNFAFRRLPGSGLDSLKIARRESISIAAASYSVGSASAVRQPASGNRPSGVWTGGPEPRSLRKRTSASTRWAPNAPTDGAKAATVAGVFLRAARVPRPREREVRRERALFPGESPGLELARRAPPRARRGPRARPRGPPRRRAGARAPGNARGRAPRGRTGRPPRSRPKPPRRRRTRARTGRSAKKRSVRCRCSSRTQRRSRAPERAARVRARALLRTASERGTATNARI